MRIQIFAVVLFGLCMWGVVFMRLQGGFVDVKVNRPKVVKGNKLNAVKSVMMRGVRRPCVVSIHFHIHKPPL